MGGDSPLPEQSIAEIIRALEAAESATSSEEDSEEDMGMGAMALSVDLNSAMADPIRMWRPGLELSKPTRHGFEAKNTFAAPPVEPKLDVAEYEMAKLDSTFRPARVGGRTQEPAPED